MQPDAQDEPPRPDETRRGTPPPASPRDQHAGGAAGVPPDGAAGPADLPASAEEPALAGLARAADATAAGGERVLILPGAMGSTLGLRGRLWSDAIWLDPVDVALGRLSWLAVDSGDPRVEPLGVVLPAYLPLLLRLRLAGFDAALHPWDWRLGVSTATERLLPVLLEGPGPVHLVGHSMGGLVAQSLLALGPAEVRARLGRVVTLGTPSWGAPVVATVLQGTHPVLTRLAALDPARDPRALARVVFGSFPSTHLVLPWRERWPGPDLDDEATWSPQWPRPRPELLAQARAEQARLAAARPAIAARVAQIVGVGRPTVTGLERQDDGPLLARVSPDGDGTVARALAGLEGATTHYSTAAHGALPRSVQVVEAVVELLRQGSTARLPTTWEPPPARAAPPAPAAEPAAPAAQPHRSWTEVLRLIQEFVGGPAAEADPADAAAPRR